MIFRFLRIAIFSVGFFCQINSQCALDLHSQEMDDAGLEREMSQVEGHQISSLLLIDSIDLSQNFIGDRGLLSLLRFPFCQLKSLNLAYNLISDDGVALLAASPYLTSLTSLSLCSRGDPAYSVQKTTHISDIGAFIIANSPTFQGLLLLDLAHNAINDIGVSSLAGSRYLHNLTALNLSSNKVNNAGVIAVAASPMLVNLRHLDLSCNRIDYNGARSLANSRTLGSLTSLELGWNQIGNEGFVAIIQSLTLLALTSLSLEDNQITEGGVLGLQGLTLNHLKSLSLGWNAFRDEGAVVLSQFRRNLQTLQSLSLEENQIGERGVSALAVAFLNVDLCLDDNLFECSRLACVI